MNARATYQPGPVTRRFRIRWVEVILTLIVCALVVALVVVGFHAATDTPQGGALQPCPTEDSTGCYWDADTMGNGTGADVATVEVER